MWDVSTGPHQQWAAVAVCNKVPSSSSGRKPVAVDVHERPPGLEVFVSVRAVLCLRQNEFCKLVEIDLIVVIDVGAIEFQGFFAEELPGFRGQRFLALGHRHLGSPTDVELDASDGHGQRQRRLHGIL